MKNKRKYFICLFLIILFIVGFMIGNKRTENEKQSDYDKVEKLLERTKNYK